MPLPGAGHSSECKGAVLNQGGSDMGQCKLLIAVGHGRKGAQVHFPLQEVRTARHHQPQW